MSKYIFSFIIFYLVFRSFASGELKEKLVVFTDRNLYICGEMVHLYAKIETTDKQISNQSKIIYVELLNTTGNPIMQTKFYTAGNLVDQCIAVPEEIPTGYYCLKCYTKGMRNFPVSDFSFVPLKLINTRSQSVAKNDNLVNSTGIADVKELQISADVAIQKYQFEKLEKIELTKGNNFELKNLCISVIPAASVVNFEVSPRQNPVKEKYILPYETDGATLSGSVVNEAGREVPNSIVNLSLTGARNNIMSAYTDSLGRYYFQLPDLNTFHELFISVDSIAENHNKLLVDNDFSPINPSLDFPQFHLTKEEKHTALALAQNLQVQKYFQGNSLVVKDSAKTVPVSYFYGHPTQIIYPAKYIQLKNLEECFKELPSQMKVTRSKKQVSIYRAYDRMPVNMLVMVDMIIVKDYNMVLDINPQLVSRIEIVNERFVKGEFIYDGIISIFSANQDFAKIKLPSTGMFLNYTFPKNQLCLIPENPKIVNSKNTYYWITNVNPDRLPRFQAPSVKGNYLIQLQGVDSKGIIRREVIPFEVK